MSADRKNMIKDDSISEEREAELLGPPRESDCMEVDDTPDMSRTPTPEREAMMKPDELVKAILATNLKMEVPFGVEIVGEDVEKLKEKKDEVPRQMFGVETASAGSATVQLQLVIFSTMMSMKKEMERMAETVDDMKAELAAQQSTHRSQLAAEKAARLSERKEMDRALEIALEKQAGRFREEIARAVELAASRRTPPTSTMSTLPMYPVPEKKRNTAPEERKTPMVMKAPPPLPRTSTPNPPKMDPQQAKPSESRKRQQEVKEDVTDVIWKLLKDMKEKEKEGETSEPPAKKKTCMLCLEPHETRSCTTFTTDVTRKQAFMMTPGRCGNCGYVGHAIAECRLEKAKCRICKGDHLPYACPSIVVPEPEGPEEEEDQEREDGEIDSD